MNQWKSDVAIGVAVVLVVLIFFGAILIGQILRNERAATITPDEFTMMFVAPEGYSCLLDANQKSYNVVTIHCEP